MAFESTIRFKDILLVSSEYPELKQGVIVDTSILFAASYPADEFNTEAEELFDYFGELEIAAYTNINIRAEFIDLHRRVMIPEGLSDLYTQNGKSLDVVLYKKLQSVYTALSESRKSGKPYKFDENQIKSWRSFLKSNYGNNSIDGWLSFCKDFLLGKIENLWHSACDEFGINFLTLRGSDNKNWIHGDLTWEDMTTLVGQFGIGSFDAMIINLFLNSKFSALVTADKDIAYVISSLKPKDKFVIVPDKLRI